MGQAWRVDERSKRVYTIPFIGAKAYTSSTNYKMVEVFQNLKYLSINPGSNNLYSTSFDRTLNI